MKTFYRSLLLATSGTLALLSTPLQAENLVQLYEDALQNDHSFLAAKAQLKSGLENQKLGRAGLLPSINAEGSWSKSDGDSKSYNFAHGALVNSEIDSTSTSYGVSLRQALFDLGAWHSYKRGTSLANEAEAGFAEAEQQLILRTAESYLTVLKAVDGLETAKAEEQALAQQLEQSKQRFEVGLTAITEVHEAQAQYDSVRANRLIAEGNLGIAFEALEVLTGRTYQSLSPLKSQFEASLPAPLDRNEWVEMAKAQNALLKLAKFQAESALANSKALKSQHYPKLYGSVSYNNSETENSPLPTEERDGTTVGVTLTVPIFQGGSTSASRRQAYQNYLIAQEGYKKANRDTVQAVRSLHLEVVTSVATVKARKQAITSSQSALEATQAGYDVGTRDLVDVLNAQRNLYLAQRNYYDALYSYILATLNLKKAAGILSEADITELNKHLDASRSVMYQG